MVDGWNRQIGDGNKERFTGSRFGFCGVESEEDSFETGEGRGIGGMDTGEVETGEERDEREDNETEVRVRGEESVVEPVTEGIGVGTGEGRGEGGVSGGGGEKGESGAFGVGEGGESVVVVREDGGEGVDSGTGFGDGFPPGVHRVVGVTVRVVVGGGGGCYGGGRRDGIGI